MFLNGSRMIRSVDKKKADTSKTDKKADVEKAETPMESKSKKQKLSKTAEVKDGEKDLVKQVSFDNMRLG
jgi:hypothetical protein